MTEKLHSVVGSDNVFRDLGFPEAEAQNLLLRGELVIHIRKVIDKLGITQAESAKRAAITQPRMNDLVKNRTHKFTLDALVNWKARVQSGWQVERQLWKELRVAPVVVIQFGSFLSYTLRSCHAVRSLT